MGQEQSVPTPGRAPNRLSKPRTHTTAANIASKSNLQLERKGMEIAVDSPVTSRSSVLPTNAAVGGEDLKEEKQQKQSKRRSLFRSKNSSQATGYMTTDTGVESKTVPAAVGLSVHRWSSQVWSRSNSLTEEAPVLVNSRAARPPNRARMSLQNVSYAQHHPRLSLVTETPYSGPSIVETKGPQHVEETAVIQANAQHPSRKNSDTEVYGLIRRRSLLQHGLATRPPQAPDPSRQSLPAQMRAREDLQSYSYDSSIPTDSTLTNFAPMRFPEPIGPRVETPDELDYRHTGAFKLGSLRITNGVASPSPSAERNAIDAEDDYISAGNDRRNMEAYLRGIGNSSTISNLPGEDIDSRWAVRSGSPLRHAYQSKADLTIITSAPLPDPSFALFDFDTYRKSFRNSDSPTKSQELANEYMLDIALSPFSFDPSQPNSPVLEATSKHTAIEDELFEAEPATPSLVHTDSGYGYGPKSVRGPRNQHLAKADSGYSSNVSLRSFRTSTSTTPAPPVPSKEAPATPPKDFNRIASSTYSISSVGSESTIRKKGSLPVLPLQNGTLPSFQNKLPTESKYLHTFNSEPQMTAHETPTKSSEHINTLTLYPPRKRQSSLPTNSLDHDYVESSNTSDRRSTEYVKNEKRRPQSIQPPSSAYVHGLSGQRHNLEKVPVSHEALRQLETGVDAFPTKSFPNTIFRLRKTSSKETLGTIFSVGSGYTDVPMTRARLESALPALPPPERKPLKLRNSYQPPPTTPKRLQKRSFSQDQRPGGLFEEGLLQTSKRPMSLSTEVSATQNLTSKRNVSGESWTSSLTNSTIITGRRSFESIARGNPWGSRSSSYEHAPKVPQSPALATLPSQRQYLDNDTCKSERRLSQGREERRATPPPVAMQTQRKAKSNSEGMYNAGPANKPMAPQDCAPQTQPMEMPPLPPPRISRPIPKGSRPELLQDHWSEHKDFWANRRQSAGNALLLQNRKSVESMPSRKSMETRRPPSTHQNSNMKMRKSLDVVRARTLPDQQFDVSPNLRQYDSFDTSQRLPRSKFPNNTGLSKHGEWEERISDEGEYNHVYGRASPNKENRLPSPQKEYYDLEEIQNDHHLQQNLHQSHNSTSDMLILDRFIGGLDYGYEPGYGLGGSAGTRNTGSLAAGGRKSVDASRSLGLDFSDVPIMLQRVKVK